jgi:RNA polymerase sigma factor (sigma-70 family)
MPRPVAELDAKLIAAAKGGDREAFDELVRRTYADTYTLAYRLTGNEEDARDVAQEAYLRAYKGLKRFRGEAQFSTWLYRITANCAATYLGRRSRHRHDVLDDSVPSSRRSITCRPVYGLSSCCGTSTTSHTRRSLRSWGSRSRLPRFAFTGHGTSSGRSCSVPWRNVTKGVPGQADEGPAQCRAGFAWRWSTQRSTQ